MPATATQPPIEIVFTEPTRRKRQIEKWTLPIDNYYIEKQANNFTVNKERGNITILNYTVELSGQAIELPYQLEKLYNAIEKSHYLIDYKEVDEDTGIS